ncbi:hypothetical protein B4N89_23470 [Embleya scabrispora]|uniref:Uncharacterized protein n=1 Tax=Embleya scabrispora TaxID=159449 RepID=A0A1T3P317_9ACTN|nr:hypothetical protein B4N89_23470 [Embleya scabrispora]
MAGPGRVLSRRHGAGTAGPAGSPDAGRPGAVHRDRDTGVRPPEPSMRSPVARKRAHAVGRQPR